VCADEPVRVCVNDLAHHEADIWIKISLVCWVCVWWDCLCKWLACCIHKDWISIHSRVCVWLLSVLWCVCVCVYVCYFTVVCWRVDTLNNVSVPYRPNDLIPMQITANSSDQLWLWVCGSAPVLVCECAWMHATICMWLCIFMQVCFHAVSP